MKKQKEKAQQGPMILVTTGGSGGHIFPAMAIAEALVRQGARVAFLTDRRGQAFQGAKKIPVYRLMAESVTGRSLIGKIWAMVKLYIGIVQAIVYLYKLKPVAVVGGGGYASIPAVMACHVSRVPVILHEQNAILGRANRLLAKGILSSRARLIGTSFSKTNRVPEGIPQVRVGLPVRPAIADYKGSPYPSFKSAFHLLIFGGSQGARFFSQKLPKALLALPANVRAKIDLVQQVREEDMATARQFYDQAGFKKVTLKSFFTDMPEQLKKAHLVIGRGGAGTLTELMVIGRPAIIIPLPSAADDHQTANARQFCDEGAGWLVPEKEYDDKAFSKRLLQLIQKPSILEKAAEQSRKLAPDDAAGKMASAVLDIVKGFQK